jgi:peptidyl-prolyl cis-trans isomerase C
MRTDTQTNKGVIMPKTSARHIFVLSLEECEQLKEMIEAGADFSKCARRHSVCPSGENGGELGTINQGQLIRELDEVLFSGEVGKLFGPVESRFGYHLIEIIRRS